MNDNERLINPQESLLLIEKMINRARDSFGENGHLYLLWGWVITICSIGHFIMWQYRLVTYPQMIWMLSWGAFIYQAVYLFRNKRNRRVKTYADDILGYVWMVFVVCMFLTVFVMIRKDGFRNLYPMFLVLYGVPTFLSGKILKVSALSMGGICCWALAIAATFIEVKYQLLLIALAVIVAWIIPGYVLQARFKKQKIYGTQ